MQKRVEGLLVAAIVFISILTTISVAAAWNFTVPATEVKPVKGVFAFPVSAFENGKARHFEYKHSPTEIVRFFVVKSTDGIIRAAFDACEQCFRAKKGYVQKGDDMVCMNCGLKFRTDKVNVVTGGCNPAGLRRTIQGPNVLISQQDVLAGLRYFQ
ncbi:MAG: DUF2318 domain-containing protein [Desulfomonilaceae bacterium]